MINKVICMGTIVIDSVELSDDFTMDVGIYRDDIEGSRDIADITINMETTEAPGTNARYYPYVSGSSLELSDTACLNTRKA